MEELTGKTISRFEIREQLGEGGMAVVYKAWDTELKRFVAFKIIRLENLTEESSSTILDRFHQEAKLLAGLSHENIVDILDYGEHNGLPWMVMEYVSGKTLKQYINERTSPLKWQEVASMLLPIARALDTAHKKHIFHRDVKPSNILLDENKVPMLTDFGIAKLLEAEETIDLTGTGVGMGTPEYMAPEQVENRSVDYRADIYALGVVFYEMVVGQKPFQADTPLAVALKHVNDPLPRPGKFVIELPEIVEGVLYKALAKDPKERFQTMADFIEVLEELANGRLPEGSFPIPKVEKKSRETRPRPGVWVGVSLIFLIAMSFFVTPTRKLIFQLAPLGDVESTPLVESGTQTLEPLKATNTAISLSTSTEMVIQTPTQTATITPTLESLPITMDNIHLLKEIRPLEMGQSVRYYNPVYYPDGSMIAASGITGIYLLDGETLEEIDYFGEEEGHFVELEFSPDGSLLASLSKKNGIQLWSIERKEIVLSFEKPESGLYDIVFSPDGKTIASAWEDGLIRLWDVETRELTATLEGHNGPVYSVDYSADGSKLASGSADMTVKIWDVETGVFMEPFQKHNAAVECVVFSPNGTYLASGVMGKIYLWNLEDYSLIRMIEETDIFGIPIEFRTPMFIAFDDSENRIVSNFGCFTIGVFNISNGAEFITTKSELSEPITNNSIFFKISRDSDSILFDNDGDIIQWDFLNDEMVAKKEGFSVKSFEITKEQKYFIILSNNNDLEIWDLQKQQLLYHIDGEKDHIVNYAISSNLKYLALTRENYVDTHNAIIEIRNLENGEVIHLLEGHKKWIGDIVFSPDCKTLASCAQFEQDTIVYFWDIESGTLKNKITKNDSGYGSVWSLQYTPDGSQIAALPAGESIKLWNAKTGNLESSLLTSLELINTFIISPDFKTVLTYSGYENMKLQLWNILDQTLIADFGEDFSMVENSFTFSANGQIVSFLGENSGIFGTHFWSVVDKEIIYSIENKKCTYFTPDGNYLICAPGDNSTLALYGIYE